MTMFDFFGMQDPERWKRLFDNLSRSGIDINDTSLFRPGATVQGTGSPSLHGRGRAADINPRDNPVGYRWQFQPAPADTLLPEMGGDTAQDQPGQRQIPGPLARWAARQGDMKWGGDFNWTGTRNEPDPMHFELNRGVAEMPQDFSRRTTFAGSTSAPLSPTGTTAGVPQTPEDFEARRRRLYQRENQGPTLAENLFGPGVGGYLNNLVRNNPAFMGSLFEIGRRGEIGLGISKAYADERQNEFNRAAKAEDMELDWRKYGLSAGDAAIRQAQEGRTASDWNRLEKQRLEREGIWNQALADPKHRLWSGLTEDEKAAIVGLGSEAGFTELAKMRFMTAEQRAKNAEALRQKKAEMDAFDAWRAGESGGAATGGGGGLPRPGAVIGPAGAPPPGSAAEPAPGGAPAAGEGVSPPPATAPAITAPGTPARSGGLMVPRGGGPGVPTQLPAYDAMDSHLRTELGATTFLGKEAGAAVRAAAEKYREAQLAGPKKYTETAAAEEAKQEAAKPQARQTMASSLDSMDATVALAKRIKSDPHLPSMLGFNSLTPNLTPEARDLYASMETLLTKQAVETLSRLKAQSTSGATGFGATNKEEFATIQNALSNLKDKMQSPAQYKQNIDTLVTSLQNAQRRMLSGWEETYREPYQHPGKHVEYPTERAYRGPEKEGAKAKGKAADKMPVNLQGKSDEEFSAAYGKLKKGRAYIAPDGSRRIKQED